MSVIILLEDGCRRPGGLQGDVEFITFDREAPERAFGRILEMLKAINPPSAARVESSPTNLESASEDADAPEPEQIGVDGQVKDEANETWTEDD